MDRDELEDAYKHSGETIEAYSESLTKAEADKARLEARVAELEGVVNEFAFNTGTDNIFCLACKAPDGEHADGCMVGRALAGDGSATADVVKAAREFADNCLPSSKKWGVDAPTWSDCKELVEALNRLPGDHDDHDDH